MLGISTGMEGYMTTHLKIWQRILCLVGGILLIIPGSATDIVGIVLVLFVFAIQHFGAKKKVEA